MTDFECIALATIVVSFLAFTIKIVKMVRDL